jgi:bacterial/archaeal transporter family protein
MEKWVFYAFLSMVFAGFTSVIAKMGLAGISGELGLTVRTLFVSLFVLGFAAISVPMNDYSLLNRTNILWLGLSALTTTLSWIFYYEGVQEA